MPTDININVKGNAESSLNGIAKSADVTSSSVARLGKSFSITGQEATKAGTTAQKSIIPAMKSMDAATKSARYTFTNFNRVVQDAPYFLQSTSFGIRAVANNIPMLLEGFGSLVTKTGGVKAAFKKLITVFSGSTGFMIAANLLISGVLAYSLAASVAERNSQKLGKAVDNLAASLANLAKVSTLESFSTVEKLKTDLQNLKLLRQVAKEAQELAKGEADRNLFSGKVKSDREREATVILTPEVFAAMNKAKSINAKFIEQTDILITNAERELHLKEASWIIQAKLNNLITTAPKIDPIPTIGIIEDISKEVTLVDRILQLRKGITHEQKVALELWNKSKPPELDDDGKAFFPKVKDEWLNKEELLYFKSAVSGLAGFMTSTFNQAWDDIFGHANSLLEQFAKSMASALSQTAFKSIAGGIIGSLIPGGSFVQGAAAAIGLKKSSSNSDSLGKASTTVVNLQVDGETFSKIIVEPNLGGMLARQNRRGVLA